MRSKSKELMKKIQQYAEQFCISNLRTPSTGEIAQALKVSKATVHNYLKAMDEQGMLSYQGGELRTRVTQQINMEQVGIPIAGAIPCGTPEEEVENIEEYIALPRAVVGDGEFFILRASGDSMVDAGIDSGDLVVVRKQLEASPGQIVAALVDGGSTLKRLGYDDDAERYVLYPENREKNYPPIEGRSISIQGVAIRVMKELA